MNPKKKLIKVHLFYCLMSLLLEYLDELKATNPRIIKLKSDLTEMCELLNNDCNGTLDVQKTTYFQRITNKIDTVMRNEINTDL